MCFCILSLNIGMTSWIWTCSSHMSTTAGACAQTARLGLQQCCICVLTLFSTLWWLTDCCMLYSPETLKYAALLHYVPLSPSAAEEDFHLCSMLWTASRTIKTLTRSSVVCWGKLMATTHFSDWIWVHVCHEIGFRLNQGWNAQTFSLCGFLGLCVRWNWIRKRSQFENDTVGVHTRGVEIVLNAVRSGHKRAW